MGATGRAESYDCWVVWFQSSPTSKGGRYLKPYLVVHDTQVSILAHLERWALPNLVFHMRHDLTVSILAHLERWALHNPWGGRILHLIVSILAHLERWALPTQSFEENDQTVGVSILAHLERWALHEPQTTSAALTVFQSSPTSKGGRYIARWNDRE